MANVTLGVFLDRCRDAELQLEASYSEIRDRSPDKGVRLLTYYLARHRRHQQQVLGGLEPGTLRQVRKAALKCDLPVDLSAELRLPDFVPESVNGVMLIEAAVAHDHKLTALYRLILAQPLDGAARDMLEALIRAEERDIAMLKKMLDMRYF